MSKKTILITGGAGFVGSNLALFLRRHCPDNAIVCFDNLIRRGSELNVERLQDAGITFIRGDIRDRKALLALPRVDVMVECSAEPSVLASYNDPDYTIQTNLIGTIHCLELAKRDRAQVIFLSTSRVYPVGALNAIPHGEQPTRFDWPPGIAGPGYTAAGIAEDFTLEGAKTLYGATKLASEHLLVEYAQMFELPAVIDRLGVIAGPWQMGKVDQGIVGFWVVQHKFSRSLKYIGYGGTGKQVRDVIHVEDVCELIHRQIVDPGEFGQMIYNVGGGRKNTFSLSELTGKVRAATGCEVPVAPEPETRPGDVRIYITDHRRLTEETGWRPQRSVDQIVTDVAGWVDRYASQLAPVLAPAE